MIDPGPTTSRDPAVAAALGALVCLYCALAFGFARATPALEASDEARHFGYVLWLVDHGTLPVAGRSGLAAQEAVQPPLYYLAGAALVGRLDLRDAPAYFRPVPGSPIGRADLPGPRQMFAHPAGPPVAQTLRAVALLRGLSIVLGGAVVVLTYCTARALAPASAATALFAAALVALNPMFIFIASSVNNDDLIAAAVAALVCVLCRPSFAPARARNAAWVGASIGVAILAKASGLVLLPFVLYRVAASATSARQAARACGVLFGTLVLVTGWWFVRNALLYGEPLPFTVQAILAGNLRPAWDPFALAREWEGFVKSFWGVFGAFNVIYPESVYRIFIFLTVTGVLSIAALLRAESGRDPRVRGLAVLAGANLLAVALWTSRVLGSQGRLLFPSISAICVLAALSVDAWPPWLRRVAWLVVPGFLLATAAWGCLVLIPAAYAPP